MEVPVVTVCLITYNHEKYVAKAIGSILSQKTDFSFDLVIADDCSKDGTRKILAQFQSSYPEKIRLILQENNVGPAENWFQLITAPVSKYIAYLEGDDYWISDEKLQQQISFLESNPDFVLCHADALTVDENGNELPQHSLKNWNRKKDDLGLEFAIFEPLAFSCTAVFRNCLRPETLSLKIKSGDWMQWILLTLNGKAKFLPEKLSAYRVGTGVSVNAVWHKDFAQRAVFLLKQVKKRHSSAQNKWLLKGSLYFALKLLAVKSRLRFLSKWAETLKYKV